MAGARRRLASRPQRSVLFMAVSSPTNSHTEFVQSAVRDGIASIA
jgi:hypothetical protein